MNRLSGYDAQFYFDELAGEYQHTLKLMFFRSQSGSEPEFGRIRELVRAAAQHTAGLRWTVKRVPLDIYHPIWVDGGDIDTNWHVKRIAIPKPGGRKELCEVLSVIASSPLATDRPLWEVWVIDGFYTGELVCLTKVHHALADGGEVVRAIQGILDSRQSMTSPQLTISEPGPSPEQEYGKWPLIVRAFIDLARNTARGFDLAISSLLRAYKHACEDNDLPRVKIRPTEAPRSPFCGPISRRRSFNYTTVRLDELNEIRRSLGGTINDVILTTVAGAVRQYLVETGDCVDKPHLGVIIGSTRREDEYGKMGNKFTSRYIWLPTHLSDSLNRWAYSREQNANAKRDIAKQSGFNVEDWIALFPPFVIKTVGFFMRLVAPRTGIGIVSISNVRGPGKQLHGGDFTLTNVVSTGHIKYSAALNVTVWSYVDKANYGFYCCPNSGVDLAIIAEQVSKEHQSLLARVRASSQKMPNIHYNSSNT